MSEPHQMQAWSLMDFSAGVPRCSPAGEDDFPVRYSVIAAPKDKDNSQDKSSEDSQKSRAFPHFSKARWRGIAFGAGIVSIFLCQVFVGSLGNLLLPSLPAKAPQPKPASPPDPKGWLCLNHAQIVAEPSGRFSLFGANNSVVTARVEGCDFVNFSLWNGTGEIQSFTVRPGQDLCQPVLLPEEVWSDAGPQAGVQNQYYIEINPSQACYFTYLGVLPMILCQGDEEVNKNDWTEISFFAAGPTHFLFDGDFSVTDFAAQIADDDQANPLVLKRNDYPGSADYPMNFTEYVQAMQGGSFLQFDADLNAGVHTLQMKGAGDLTWVVLTDADSDLDGLKDYVEAQCGLNMTIPNIWGYQTVIGEQSSVQDLLDHPDTYKVAWQQVQFTFYISPVFANANNFLFADALCGDFENFSSDANELPLMNVSLHAFEGQSSRGVTIYVNGEYKMVPESELSMPDSAFLGQYGTGFHTITFFQKDNPLQPPSISFRDNLQVIQMLDSQTATNQLLDSDGDGLPDGIDKDPTSSLQWNPGTALRIAIPYTAEDRADGADVRIQFQVAPPAVDYSKGGVPLKWGDYEGNVIVQPAMRLFGVGPQNSAGNWYPDQYTSSEGYWYKDETWTQFWGKSIVPYSLVGIDSSGSPYDPMAGTNQLPGAGNHLPGFDLLPGDKDTVDGYYMFEYPDRADNTWTYTIDIPSDHPILTSGHITLTFDFCWQVFFQNPANNSLSVEHIYDFVDPSTIQSCSVTYTSSLRYMLCKPQSHAEYLGLYALVKNPACEVVQPTDYYGNIIDPLQNRIVKTESNVPLFQRFNYDANDYTTYSIADRIAYWRQQYPRAPGDSEVVFYADHEKEIDVLTRLNLNTLYDTYVTPQLASRSAYFDGTNGPLLTEDTYGDYPGTYSFTGLAGHHPDTLGPQWSGSWNAVVVPHVRQFKDVLGLFGYGSPDVSVTVDAQNPADSASVEFWTIFENPCSLDVKLTSPSGQLGPFLRFEDGNMGYVQADGFHLLKSEAVWPNEPIQVSLWYNCTNQSFIVQLGGAGFDWAARIPFYDSGNSPSSLQYVTWTEPSQCNAYIDAVGLTQAPYSTPDEQYNRSENAIWYDAWHRGLADRFVAWSTISDLYNGAVSSSDLTGDHDVVWEESWEDGIHQRAVITLDDFPVKFELTRATDLPTDGLVFTDIAKTTFAQGIIAATVVVPTSVGAITGGGEIYNGVTFDCQYFEELSSGQPLAGIPPQVQLQTATSQIFDRTDTRIGQVDPWVDFYEPHSGTKAAKIIATNARQKYYDNFQSVMWDAITNMEEKLTVMLQVDPNFAITLPDWYQIIKSDCVYWVPTWDGEEFVMGPGGLYSYVQPVQPDGRGIYYRKTDENGNPLVNPERIPLDQIDPKFLTEVVNRQGNVQTAWRNTYTLEDFWDWVDQARMVRDFVQECYAKVGTRESVKFITWVDFAPQFTDVADQLYADLRNPNIPTDVLLSDYGVTTLDDFFTSITPGTMTNNLIKDLNNPESGRGRPLMARECDVVVDEKFFARVLRWLEDTKGNRLELVAGSMMRGSEDSLAVLMPQPRCNIILLEPADAAAKLDEGSLAPGSVILKARQYEDSEGNLVVKRAYIEDFYYAWLCDDTLVPGRELGWFTLGLHNKLEKAAAFLSAFEEVWGNTMKYIKGDLFSTMWSDWTIGGAWGSAADFQQFVEYSFGLRGVGKYRARSSGAYCSFYDWANLYFQWNNKGFSTLATVARPIEPAWLDAILNNFRVPWEHLRMNPGNSFRTSLINDWKELIQYYHDVWVGTEDPVTHKPKDPNSWPIDQETGISYEQFFVSDIAFYISFAPPSDSGTYSSADIGFFTSKWYRTTIDSIIKNGRTNPKDYCPGLCWDVAKGGFSSALGNQLYEEALFTFSSQYEGYFEIASDWVASVSHNLYNALTYGDLIKTISIFMSGIPPEVAIPSLMAFPKAQRERAQTFLGLYEEWKDDFPVWAEKIGQTIQGLQTFFRDLGLLGGWDENSFDPNAGIFPTDIVGMVSLGRFLFDWDGASCVMVIDQWEHCLRIGAGTGAGMTETDVYWANVKAEFLKAQVSQSIDDQIFYDTQRLFSWKYKPYIDREWALKFYAQVQATQAYQESLAESASNAAAAKNALYIDPDLNAYLSEFVEEWTAFNCYYPWWRQWSDWFWRQGSGMILESVGFFQNILQMWPTMTKEHDALIASGFSEQDAEAQLFNRYWLPQIFAEVGSVELGGLLSSWLTGLFIDDELFAGLYMGAGLSFAEGTLTSAATMGLSYLIFFIVNSLWEEHQEQVQQTLAECQAELNFKLDQNTEIPAQEQEKIARVGGLEVGDTLNINTKIENFGHRDYNFDPYPFGTNSWVPIDDNDPTCGGAFWFRVRYAVTSASKGQPGKYSSEWVNWQGQWNTVLTPGDWSG
ncbi:MAG TPA: hypothetical protein VKK79_22830, partial [Candidatus Lokiarchaeia archaeon]|nr:hypothetical protein [Candidatus Lokiarchaeia archaeon]